MTNVRVRVKVLGALARPQGKDDLEVEVAAGASLEELLLTLGYARPQLRYIVTAVNGAQERLTCRLAAGDEVVLFLPASGG